MRFASLQDFVAMGGHGLEVWTSWAIGVVVVTAIVLRPLRARRRFFAEEKRRLARDARSESQPEGDNASTTT